MTELAGKVALVIVEVDDRADADAVMAFLLHWPEPCRPHAGMKTPSTGHSGLAVMSDMSSVVAAGLARAAAADPAMAGSA